MWLRNYKNVHHPIDNRTDYKYLTKDAIFRVPFLSHISASILSSGY